VRRIVSRLTAQSTVFRPDAARWNWEANVFSSDELNAWCMAGGKMAIYTGLIDRLRLSDDEIAAVMGHEIAHALREHSREQVSKSMATGLGVSMAGALLGVGDLGQDLMVLVLTAQDSVDFKVQALRAGADDYVTKPFSFEELLARVEALGRRPKQLSPPVLKVADLELDTGTREVKRGGRVLDLTPKEYAVLEYLIRHPGRVMSRTLITEYAWDYHFDPGTNIVDVVINRLRKKVDTGATVKLIHTVRGVGYVVKPGEK
jgi:DNA-binding NarL/FixJ family response regulator